MGIENLELVDESFWKNYITIVTEADFLFSVQALPEQDSLCACLVAFTGRVSMFTILYQGNTSTVCVWESGKVALLQPQYNSVVSSFTTELASLPTVILVVNPFQLLQ